MENNSKSCVSVGWLGALLIAMWVNCTDCGQGAHDTVRRMVKQECLK